MRDESAQVSIFNAGRRSRKTSYMKKWALLDCDTRWTQMGQARIWKRSYGNMSELIKFAWSAAVISFASKRNVRVRWIMCEQCFHVKRYLEASKIELRIWTIRWMGAEKVASEKYLTIGASHWRHAMLIPSVYSCYYRGASIGALCITLMFQPNIYLIRIAYIRSFIMLMLQS